MLGAGHNHVMTEQLFFAAAAGFEAAREVSLLPEGHRARRLHGHSFLAKIRVSSNDRLGRFPGDDVEALRRRLIEAVAPLDYAHLNQRLDQPTDENLARWVRKRLDVAGVHNVGIQSTMHEGVDLDRDEHAHVWRRYVFQSAHQ